MFELGAVHFVVVGWGVWTVCLSVMVAWDWCAWEVERVGVVVGQSVVGV